MDIPQSRALWAILAAALVLRIIGLDAPLWYDEIATLTEYVRAPFGVLIADYSSFNNHLFYSLQAKLSVLAFGETAWALRLPALLFGIGSIWLLHRLAARITAPKTALLAAALMAASYHHIWFSQNARGYTELMFWSLAALVAFVESIGQSSWRRWGVFAVCLAAAMYTHLTAAFFIAALGVSYVLMLGVRWLRIAAAPEGLRALEDVRAQWAPLWGFIAGGALTLLLCAPALPQMFTLVGGVEGAMGADVMQEYRNPLWAVAEGLRTLAGGDGLIMLAAAPALALIGVGAVSLWRPAPVVVLCAVLLIPITIGALSLVSMRIWPRFFFTELAFAFLFLAQGAAVAAHAAARWAAPLRLQWASSTTAFAAAALVMLGASLVLAARNYAYPKQNLPAPIALIAEAGAPAQAVGVVGIVHEMYGDYFRTGWRVIAAPADLDQLARDTGPRWVVAGFPARTSRENADVWAVLERDYDIAAFYPGTLGDGGLFVFREKPRSAPD